MLKLISNQGSQENKSQEVPLIPPPRTLHISFKAASSLLRFSCLGTPSDGVISPTIAIKVQTPTQTSKPPLPQKCMGIFSNNVSIQSNQVVIQKEAKRHYTADFILFFLKKGRITNPYNCYPLPPTPLLLQ